MFQNSAKDIWDALQQTYSKAKDAAWVYEVKVKTMVVKQDNKTVAKYANMLQNLWHELDHHRVIEIRRSEDAMILKNLLKRIIFFIFYFVGPNAEFDQIRIEILGKEDVPSLNEVISLTQSEESQRGIMLKLVSNDGSTTVAWVSTNCNMVKEATKSDSRDNLWCMYSKKPHHTKDRC